MKKKCKQYFRTVEVDKSSSVRPKCDSAVLMKVGKEDVATVLPTIVLKFLSRIEILWGH